jgi:hypothetical protein
MKEKNKLLCAWGSNCITYIEGLQEAALRVYGK